jgi:hypothetical protein
MEHIEVRMVLRSAITASSSATSGQTASNHPTTCGAGAVTCTRSAREREYVFYPNILQLLVSGRRNLSSCQLSRVQSREGGDAEKIAEDTQNHSGKGVLLQLHHSMHILRGEAPREDKGRVAASDTSGGSCISRHSGTQGPCGLAPTQTADNRSVISGP